jgi:putative glycosyltransferase
MNRVRLSIVVTLYRSPSEISELVRRLVEEATRLVGQDFEIVCVDDGCPLGSGKIVKDLMQTVPQLSLISHSRNFGQHEAIMSGLAHATGSKVFLLDGDLEELPEWLPKFWQTKEITGADVVYGYQEVRRRGGWLDSELGTLGFVVLNKLTNLNLKPNLVTARLMSKEYVDSLLSFTERSLFVAGLWEAVGFNQVAVEVSKDRTSQSNYRFSWKLNHFIDAITSFSSKPLVWVGYFGLLAGLVSTGIVTTLVVLWWLREPVPGWTSVLASVWLIGGMLLISFGIVARYLAIIFLEVKARPRAVVRSYGDGD